MSRFPSDAISRRSLLASAGAAGLLAPFGLGACASAPAGDPLQAWLSKSIVPVRTLDAADEDFSDLEPLIQAIGAARVVQLGEPSHGCGTSFAAKVRLVKFLHQKMDFEVLAWESGFYDVERTQAALRAADDAVEAAQLGILKIWSASEECRPLFEYARASHSRGKALSMAGIDMQFTAPGAFDDLAADLRAFASSAGDPDQAQAIVQMTEEVLAAFGDLYAYSDARGAKASALTRSGVTGAARGDAMAAWETETGASLRPGREALERLQVVVPRLTSLVTSQTSLADPAKRGFLLRAIANLGGYGENLFELYNSEAAAAPDASLVRENRRDRLNAENLRWQIEEAYPGKKVIVWAHNAHVMNAYYGSDWRSVHLESAPGTMKPTGAYLAECLGKDVYTIGFTAYEGSDGWVGAPPVAVAPASEVSVEAKLNQLGVPFAFLDLRGARERAGHPLRQPQVMRVPKYDEVTLADATQPYDALFFLARTSPATLIV